MLRNFFECRDFEYSFHQLRWEGIQNVSSYRKQICKLLMCRTAINRFSIHAPSLHGQARNTGSPNVSGRNCLPICLSVPSVCLLIALYHSTPSVALVKKTKKTRIIRSRQAYGGMGWSLGKGTSELWGAFLGSIVVRSHSYSP